MYGTFKRGVWVFVKLTFLPFPSFPFVIAFSSLLALPFLSDVHFSSIFQILWTWSTNVRSWLHCIIHLSFFSFFLQLYICCPFLLYFLIKINTRGRFSGKMVTNIIRNSRNLESLDFKSGPDVCVERMWKEKERMKIKEKQWI